MCVYSIYRYYTTSHGVWLICVSAWFSVIEKTNFKKNIDFFAFTNPVPITPILTFLTLDLYDYAQEPNNSGCIG